MLLSTFSPSFEYESVFNDVHWPWAGHKNFIYDLLRNIKPKKIVELGTHKGTSLLSMCQAIKDGKFDCEIHAIDTWKGDKHSGFYGDSIIKELQATLKKFYPKVKVHLIRKTFDEARSDYKSNFADILHIDGLHTYKAVYHDYHNWKDVAKKDGIILLHDTAEKGRGFGVHKLWFEIENKGQTFAFDHSHGLGILLKSKKYPLSSNLVQLLKQYYESLHKKCLIAQERDQIEHDLNQIIGELEMQKYSLQEKVTGLEEQLYKIQSSKVYRIWQRYCKIRDSIIKK